MSENMQKKVNEFMQRFMQLAAKDGLTQARLEAYAYSHAVRLAAIFAETKYPRGLSVRDAIVAGIL